ncbi:hypothetical protein [Streptomyces albogriseolus]|uniref:hypothetical protein n=1 Tax=Streptomyces albogriseolus TaxID=1887 RepID=UPI0034610DB8
MSGERKPWEGAVKRFVVMRRDGDDLRGVLRGDGRMEVFDDPDAPLFAGEVGVRTFYGGVRRTYVVWEDDEPPEGFEEVCTPAGVVSRVREEEPAPAAGDAVAESFGGTRSGVSRRGEEPTG